MEVVPVVDLKGGVVVRARHGDRAAYRPIETPLSATPHPLDVIAGLLTVNPFRTLYIADLDAIEGVGDSNAVLEDISKTFPDLTLWVDNGCATLSAARTFLGRFNPRDLAIPIGGLSAEAPEPAAHAPPPLQRTGKEEAPPHACLVLGSESQRDGDLVRTLRDDPRIILSLDFRGEGFLGPDELLSNPELWPHCLIVMTLARVGSDAGPEIERHAAVRKKGGSRSTYMAGGLRDRRDLESVKASGAAGILVATALHDGRISAADLKSV